MTITALHRIKPHAPPLVRASELNGFIVSAASQLGETLDDFIMVHLLYADGILNRWVCSQCQICDENHAPAGERMNVFFLEQGRTHTSKIDMREFKFVTERSNLKH